MNTKKKRLSFHLLGKYVFDTNCMLKVALKKRRGICDTITEKANYLEKGNNFSHLKEGQFGKKKGSCLNSPYLKVIK